MTEADKILGTLTPVFHEKAVLDYTPERYEALCNEFYQLQHTIRQTMLMSSAVADSAGATLQKLIDPLMTAKEASLAVFEFKCEGFQSKTIQKLLKRVKSQLFNVPDKTGSFNHLEGLECIYVSSSWGYNSYDASKPEEFYGDHFNFEFINKKQNEHFIIALPIAENFRFKMDDIGSKTLGRYVLKRFVFEMHTGTSHERRVIDCCTELSKSKFAEDLTAYLAEKKFRDVELFHMKHYGSKFAWSDEISEDQWGQAIDTF